MLMELFNLDAFSMPSVVHWHGYKVIDRFETMHRMHTSMNIDIKIGINV